MKSYQDLLKHVMENGQDRTDRTGIGTRSVFGYEWRHNMVDGFPLLTTKKVHFKSVLVELLWFLRGETNIQFLHDYGVTIWDEWADANGDLGPVYGKQWRDFNGVDQISNLLSDLVKKPDSRRHIVSAWNPADVPKMKLPPCHTLWQCYVGSGGILNLRLYARSIDSFLGLPFNIASYGLLLAILAKRTKLTPGVLSISFGDLHIYRNHFDQVVTQLAREPRSLPKLTMYDIVGELPIELLIPAHFEITDYDPHPGIKAPIAI